MIHMLCWNRVQDFDRWKKIFSSHREAHLAAGLKLVHLWKTVDDPNNVYFLYEVDSIDKVRAFMATPEATAAREASGVIEGDYHFLQDGGSYST